MNAVRFVEALNETPDIVAHDSRERDVFRRDNRHVDIAGAKRRGDFQSDEAGAHDDRALSRLSGGDDRTAVRRCPQIMHVRLIAAGDRQTNRIGAGGDENRIERSR